MVWIDVRGGDREFINLDHVRWILMEDRGTEASFFLSYSDGLTEEYKVPSGRLSVLRDIFLDLQV